MRTPISRRAKPNMAHISGAAPGASGPPKAFSPSSAPRPLTATGVWAAAAIVGADGAHGLASNVVTGSTAASVTVGDTAWWGGSDPGDGSEPGNATGAGSGSPAGTAPTASVPDRVGDADRRPRGSVTDVFDLPARPSCSAALPPLAALGVLPEPEASALPVVAGSSPPGSEDTSSDESSATLESATDASDEPGTEDPIVEGGRDVDRAGPGRDLDASGDDGAEAEPEPVDPAEPVVSANAKPGSEEIAAPTPKATASAPTRPIWPE